MKSHIFRSIICCIVLSLILSITMYSQQTKQQKQNKSETRIKKPTASKKQTTKPKGKRKSSRVRKKKKITQLKPVIPILDSTIAMENLSLSQCDSDSVSLKKISLIREINNWSHVRYRKGGSTKKGVDCSGFVSQLYKHSLEIELPRTSREQYMVGDSVQKPDLQFGDLVFFKRGKKTINHVGMYVMNGQFVHASSHEGVTLESLSSAYFAKRYVGAKRIVDFSLENSEDEESDKSNNFDDDDEIEGDNAEK